MRKHHLRVTNTNFALKQIIWSSIAVYTQYTLHWNVVKALSPHTLLSIYIASLAMMMTARIYICINRNNHLLWCPFYIMLRYRALLLARWRRQTIAQLTDTRNNMNLHLYKDVYVNAMQVDAVAVDDDDDGCQTVIVILIIIMRSRILHA